MMAAAVKVFVVLTALKGESAVVALEVFPVFKKKFLHIGKYDFHPRQSKPGFTLIRDKPKYLSAQ